MSSPSKKSPFDLNDLYSASGIVAVVTGGGTGIGLMIASALEHNGATVYIVGRRLEKLQKAALEHSHYGKIIPIVGDVTSKESIQSFVAEIGSKSGYINLLVNNAGLPGRITNKMVPPAPFTKPAGVLEDIGDVQKMLWEDTVEDWQATYATNVWAPYFTTVGFLELLAKGRETLPQGSQVVTVSSISGFAKMNTTSFLYNTSKAASTHLGKMLATSLTPWDIRSNIIAPGVHPSEMVVGVHDLTSIVPKERIPLQRNGTAEEMGGVILFMAGRAGAYMNGCVIVTDGGRLSVMPSTY